MTGNVTYHGDDFINYKGICWNESGSPTIQDHRVTLGGGSGSYTHAIGPLVANTTYYARAYASVFKGWVYKQPIEDVYYGNELTFTTLAYGSITFNPEISYGTVPDVEGNVYQTVQLGEQVWMAENLRTTKFNDGSPIPYLPDQELRGIHTGPSYCWYDNGGPNYADVFGALYNHSTIERDNLCPAGWHVPSRDEWETLIESLGGPEVAGGKLRESGTDHWLVPNEDATNESGFTAMPAGYRYADDGFREIGYEAYFWSSSLSPEGHHEFWYLRCCDEGIYSRDLIRYILSSVRCIRDE